MSEPRRFGKFELLGELGEGAMGKVFRARDPVLDRMVALKTIAPAVLVDKSAVARFQREAKAAARLQHPAIVTVYELGEVDGTRYIAMELVEGVSLGEALGHASGLTLAQKVRVVVEICRGLDFAHKMGVVHRDVKPANISVTRELGVKIFDFGIARLGESDITHAGVVLGTPSYVSPELLQGARVDFHADMWAVGVILYETLAGRRPFEAPTIASLVQKIVRDPPPALDAQKLGIPPALAAAATKALAKEPADRFADLAAMAAALLSAIGATPAPDAPLDPVVRRRAYEANFAEARRLLADGDLTGALEAARRARRLDDARTGVLALIKVIEERLGEDRTAPRPRPVLPDAGAAPARGPAETSAVLPGPLDTATLRTRGAAVFRDQGTFGEPAAANDAALSPAADVFALAGADGAVRVFDLRTRTRLHLLRTEIHQRTGHDAAALAVAYSPDGSLLASAHVDGCVHLWDATKGEHAGATLRHDESVASLAFSPDGATLATGSLDAQLRLWDVGAALAGEARREVVRQPSPVTAVAWLGGGEWILTGHASRVLRLIDARSGRLLATLRGPEGRVDLTLLSPDCQHLVVGSDDRMLRLYDLGTREIAAAVGPLRRPPASACFLADGAFLATTCRENSIQLWDLETRSAASVLWGPAGEAFVSVALFGDSNHLAAAIGDGRIRVWAPAH